MSPILLRYHEIAIKGANRRWFEDQLAKNAKRLIQQALGTEYNDTLVSVQYLHGRIVVDAPWSESTQSALQKLFGLSSFSPATRVPTSLDEILKISLNEFKTHIEKHGLPKTFRVKTRRSDKVLPETSMEVDRIVGSAIHDAYPTLEVDLAQPQISVGIEIRRDESFVCIEKIAGPGGLPVGTNGKVLTLISGGLDSPIAALQILKRGSPTEFVHFYGTPFVGEEALEKVEDLVRKVNEYQPEPLPLHVIPFGKIQEKIALASSPKMRTILYRRMMLRIATQLAVKRGALALVTGESLGQVASQTLENLATINAVTTLPILRPLIGLDKEEIIERAHRFKTFEISVRPATDCCTLFSDRHPILRSDPFWIAEAEKSLPIQEWVNESLAHLT